MSRYVEISEDEMRKLMDDMGFVQVFDNRVRELMFERDVQITGRPVKHSIRVYTSIAQGASRDVGTDAIRVVLMDKDTGHQLQVERRVYRTKSALTNLRERARDLWKEVKDGPACPDCDRVMVERVNARSGDKFLGCTGFKAGCRGTRKLTCQAA